MLDAEIKEHEAVLEQLVRACAPTLMEAPGVSTGIITAAAVAMVTKLLVPGLPW
jgi:hypothetical protein